MRGLLVLLYINVTSVSRRILNLKEKHCSGFKTEQTLTRTKNIFLLNNVLK